MDIQKVVTKLIKQKIINPNIKVCEELNGGTVSTLYLLTSEDGTKYVIKANDPQIIKTEVYFLNFYKENDLLPNLLFMDPSHHYIVYSFLSGSSDYTEKNKKEILKALVKQLINNYKAVPSKDGWGWADELSNSWQGFLLNEITIAKEILDSYLGEEEFNFILKLVKSEKRNILSKESFLLHGDCGIHNFIFDDGKLKGVIDPTPVIGNPLYDLIYAFCSSPDDLTKETLDSVVSHLTINNSRIHEVLYEELLIGLYLRLKSCIKHHPDDFNNYIKAWFYWKDILKNT
ncbi:aminoglycoside phosphotransferase family protein [Priestia filamentosa]|uniref:aminoglycoside phosphotransferase family protein n=1 Tax=Priestia filamentosa TaxID=1402861 RepID=UPI001C1E3AD3|nr:aminoglycoside phosphotransferase family protein [Priestia filamentosa]